MSTAVETWIEEPLMQFIADSRVRVVVLLEPSGRVLAKHGFTRSIDVMSACALAAAIDPSAAELGRQPDGTPCTTSDHAGHERQVCLGGLATGHSAHILLTVFD